MDKHNSKCKECEHCCYNLFTRQVTLPNNQIVQCQITKSKQSQIHFLCNWDNNVWGLEFISDWNLYLYWINKQQNVFKRMFYCIAMIQTIEKKIDSKIIGIISKLQLENVLWEFFSVSPHRVQSHNGYTINELYNSSAFHFEY